MANPKRPTDFNQRALQVVLEATGQALKQQPDQKDAAAVKRGRTGAKLGPRA